jgi:hypothetical protein
MNLLKEVVEVLISKTSAILGELRINSKLTISPEFPEKVFLQPSKNDQDESLHLKIRFSSMSLDLQNCFCLWRRQLSMTE